MVSPILSIRKSRFRPKLIKQELPRVAVLGAGHGGQAMAGHLGLMGCEVTLYNRSQDRIGPIGIAGGIELTGQIEGVGKLALVTTDIELAIKDAELIMVVVPANGHAPLAEVVAPYLADGQIIVLHPGRTGGALEFFNTIRSNGCVADVIVSEASTLIYACRMLNPAKVHIFGIKNIIPVAAIPSYRTPEVINKLNSVYPQFVPGDNVLKTSLDNIGAIFHPALTILNAGRIESTHGEFEFYMDGATPAVTRVLETLDKERIAVAAALGIRAMSAREWLYVAYDAPGRTLFEAMQANIGYKGITAPPTTLMRYITEDVPMSLVPIASIGNHLGVPTPMIDSMIHLASVIHETDYWAEGRTVDTMGLAELSVKQIRQLVLGGKLDA
ncbi:MAG: NAD/NADP octopine/nopaline dehydrogenase [Bacillota bacterium]|nr:MAG: NAD/NADP octopine/nopaline dehydrogenase [Bacillota bacterium]